MESTNLDSSTSSYTSAKPTSSLAYNNRSDSYLRALDQLDRESFVLAKDQGVQLQQSIPTVGTDMQCVDWSTPPLSPDLLSIPEVDERDEETPCTQNTLSFQDVNTNHRQLHPQSDNLIQLHEKPPYRHPPRSDSLRMQKPLKRIDPTTIITTPVTNKHSALHSINMPRLPGINSNRIAPTPLQSPTDPKSTRNFNSNSTSTSTSTSTHSTQRLTRSNPPSPGSYSHRNRHIKTFNVQSKGSSAALDIHESYLTITWLIPGTSRPNPNIPVVSVDFELLVAIDRKKRRRRSSDVFRSAPTGRVNPLSFTIYSASKIGEKRHKPPFNRLEFIELEFSSQTMSQAAEIAATLAACTDDILANRPKRILVFVNPVSGNGTGMKTLAKLRSLFDIASLKLEIIKTTHGGHAGEMCRTENLEPYDGIVVISGDGMVNEILNGIMLREDGYKPVVGLIPCGSTNTFCYTIMGNDDHASCALHIIFGHETQMDLGKVDRANEKPSFFGFFAHGFFGDVMRQSQSLRSLGSARYNVSGAYMVMRGRSYNATIKCSGVVGSNGQDVVVDGRYKSILVSAIQCRHSKTPYGVGPDIKLNDGKMIVIMIEKCNMFRYLNFMMRISSSGRHLELPYVKHVICDEVTIFPQPKKKKTFRSKHKQKAGLEPEYHPPSWNCDGELLEDSSATLVMQKQAMPMFCPRRREEKGGGRRASVPVL